MTTTLDAQRPGMNGVGDTSLWMAAYRARESRRPDRLYEDPFAEWLAGERGVEMLTHFHTSRANDAGNPYLAIRTRWFDDYVLSGVRTAPQAVGLGAGLDTRALRLDWPDGVTVFEVDQPAVLAYKAERLAALDARPRCERRPVPVDLAGDWSAALDSAGHDPATPTTWFCEGVLFYLPKELAAEVLRTAARRSAPGSTFACDTIGPGIFSFPYTRAFLDRLQAAGSPWRWGDDDVRGFVESCGWSNAVVAEPGNPSANYGRWPAAASPTGLPNLPRIYLTKASIAH